MSSRRFVLLAAALLVLAACTTHRGWSGGNATPFDTAQADCDAKTRDLPAGKERESAFDACMKDHGWRRP